MEFGRRGFLSIGTSSLLAAPLMLACERDTKGASDCPGEGRGASSKPPPEAIAADVTLINTGILLEQGAVLAYTAATGLPFITADKTVMAVRSS